MDGGSGCVTKKYKLVLFGDAAVGKTSLVLQFVKGNFSNEPQEATIGVAFQSKIVCLQDSTVKFEIWDTAGSARYQGLAPMYYRGADAAIVVFDITNEDSFTKAKTWICTLQTQVKKSIILALAGNKSDLKYHKSVDRQKIQEFVEENDLVFMETSAKSGNNVTNMFLSIATKLVAQEKEKKALEDQASSSGHNTTSTTNTTTSAAVAADTLVDDNEVDGMSDGCCCCCCILL
ncbi:ras-related protein Rab-5B-like [Antedon mediterranea]|uniref:ras-related protein Rab-5B-like n=1 Tax=Antedon mediterranea TaxID=105859 RepID=UPI003AF4A299